jgi:DNA-binding CsgD family transcriptional regulator
MPSQIDLKNHISLTSAKDIQQICAPLFELLGITYFNFTRVYADGGRIRLCTDPLWVEYFYSSELYKTSVFERNPGLYIPGQFLWSQCDTNPSLEVLKQHLREGYNRANVLSIVKPQQTFMDVFNIAGQSQDTEINNKYLTYMSCIHKFLNYFLIKAAKFIALSEKARFFVPIEQEQFLSDDGSGLQKGSISHQFMEKLEFKQVFISNKKNNILLSPRETQSLILTLKGKSAKEIGRELNLSPRSVETYIENIKRKVDCPTRGSLFSYALQSESIQWLLRKDSI